MIIDQFQIHTFIFERIQYIDIFKTLFFSFFSIMIQEFLSVSTITIAAMTIAINVGVLPKLGPLRALSLGIQSRINSKPHLQLTNRHHELQILSKSINVKSSNFRIYYYVNTL